MDGVAEYPLVSFIITPNQFLPRSTFLVRSNKENVISMVKGISFRVENNGTQSVYLSFIVMVLDTWSCSPSCCYCFLRRLKVLVKWSSPWWAMYDAGWMAVVVGVIFYYLHHQHPHPQSIVIWWGQWNVNISIVFLLLSALQLGKERLSLFPNQIL